MLAMLDMNLAWFFLFGGATFIAVAAAFRGKWKFKDKNIWRVFCGIACLTMCFSVLPAILYLFLGHFTANIITLIAFCLFCLWFGRLLLMVISGVPLPGEILDKTERFEKKVNKLHDRKKNRS